MTGRTARTARVPAGTDLARFATSGHADLSVFRGAALVGRSTDGASEVTLDDPRPGAYRVLASDRRPGHRGAAGHLGGPAHRWQRRSS